MKDESITSRRRRLDRAFGIASLEDYEQVAKAGAARRRAKRVVRIRQLAGARGNVDAAAHGQVLKICKSAAENPRTTDAQRVQLASLLISSQHRSGVGRRKL